MRPRSPSGASSEPIAQPVLTPSVTSAKHGVTGEVELDVRGGGHNMSANRLAQFQMFN